MLPGDNCFVTFYTGSAIPMPPELMELYSLYKQELETRNNNEKENQFVSGLNDEIIKVREAAQ